MAAVRSPAPLSELDPFEIFDTEAERLDRFFSALGEEDWQRPSRCHGWSVRDVLAHLAGEELYNHACLDGGLGPLGARLEREGVEGGYDGFNEWCVRERRHCPVADVLAEWREKNGETRTRMRELGPEAVLETAAGLYPVGLQTFHYDSEYATHADDVGAPVEADEAGPRTHWRVQVGLLALGERGPKVRAESSAGRIRVSSESEEAQLAPDEFVAATVGRLPIGHLLAPELRAALRVLA